MRLSSCEGAIRSVKSVFCWKINFHRWVGGWPVAGSSEKKSKLCYLINKKCVDK